MQLKVTAIFTTLSLAVAALAGPAPLRAIERYSGDVTGQIIVKVKDGVSTESLVRSLGIRPTHNFENLNSFSGRFDENSLNLIRAHGSVELVAEDGIMHTMDTTTQTDAPWGLSRISALESLSTTISSVLTYNYTYDTIAGSGVDIYIVDTGINTDHVTFGGRARWGATFGNYTDADGSGHGTHCAGIAGGAQYGVAKSANIIAVKVLDNAGSGSVTDIANGLNWVISQVRASGRPSVVSMSLAGDASSVLDSAVASLTDAGIHVTVAAGNSCTDTANTSPARAPSAITVGASTITDARAAFSNFGAAVDIWAPGKGVISAWIGSTTATNTLSGTSMATPHIAGLIAYLISTRGNVSPADMSTLLKTLAQNGVISDIPTGTINTFAHNA